MDLTKYKQGKFLGNGAFGDVYLFELREGEVPENGIKRMAMKNVYVTEKNRETVLKEVDIIRRLKHHDNIVEYLGHYVSEHHIHIMLEYMSGGSVKDLLEQSDSPFSEEKTKRYTRDVMKGLCYLHGMKLIHRDIKGANILIDDKDRAKLADFGLSKIMESNKSAHTSCGTPCFMSPEIILTDVDKSGHGLKTDIWSIGCVVVQMLSSVPPWGKDAGIKQYRLMQLITTCTHPEYTLPEGVSDEARDFINNCFVIKAENRPSAADLSGHPFLE